MNNIISNAINRKKQYNKTLDIIDANSEEVKNLKKQIENYEKFKNKIGNLSFINSVYILVKDRLFDAGFTDKLNKELFVLPIAQEKVIDLKTNEVCQRERKHNFSSVCPVVYDENNIEFGLQYFASLFPDTATRQCVINAIKSSMTGMPLRNIFIWIGGGCNGKSLLLKVVRKILSDFCGVVPKNIIINSKSSSNITSELEPLSTLRFGQISELSDSDSLNETRVKEFTGDGIINYRGLFQKEKNVDVTATVHIATNNMPQIDCSDPALVTRIIPFPFNAVFKQDSDYANLVMSNLDSIFSYIIKFGEVKKSFVISDMSEEIKQCRKEKIIDNDLLVSFVHERLKVNLSCRVSVAGFIENYKSFLSDCKEICVTPDKKIMALLRKLGFVIVRSNHVYYIEHAELKIL